MTRVFLGSTHAGDKVGAMGSAKRVNLEDVRLEQGKGSKGRGGGPRGHYWHVYVRDKRAGFVYINFIDEPPVGEHASIQIEINKASQGRGIGPIAYRLASEASQYDEIYAHMRKSNKASRAAAERAGYEVIEHPAVRQLLMRWQRPKT